jgi:hypothetical protein
MPHFNTEFQQFRRVNHILNTPTLGIPVGPEPIKGIENSFQIALGVLIDLHYIDPQASNLPQLRSWEGSCANSFRWYPTQPILKSCPFLLGRRNHRKGGVRT